MSRTRNLLTSHENHIRTLRLVIVGLIALCLFMAYGWKSAPSHMRIDIPPDLRNGATMSFGERQTTFVYQFAYYIFQQLNRWPSNGSKDYIERIHSLRNYTTPGCQQYLEEDYKKRNIGMELRERERTVTEMVGRGFSPERVHIESSDSWVVFLDLQINEELKGAPVKDTFVRYPVRVVSYDGDPESNKFGLLVDCFASDPKRIDQPSAATVANN